MIRRALILTAMCPLALAPAAPRLPDAPTSGLCRAGEAAIFACRVGAKQVSVCGGQANGRRYAQYRFGRPGKLELTYPVQPAGGLRFASIAYSGGGEGQVSFDRAGFRYVVFSRMVRTRFDGGPNEPRFESGVVVMRGAKVAAKLPCNPRDSGNVDYQLAEKYMPRGEPVDLP